MVSGKAGSEQPGLVVFLSTPILCLTFGVSRPLETTLPALGEELRKLFVAAGRSDLAGQVSALQIVGRCQCGDDFCATIYTKPRPRGAYGPGHETLDLDAEEGMILVDVVDGSIACIEVLYRDEIRRQLLDALS